MHWERKKQQACHVRMCSKERSRSYKTMGINWNKNSKHKKAATRGTRGRFSDRSAKQRKPGFIERTISAWFNRLMGAASKGSFSEEEEQYSANRTSRDYIWNTIGISAWGMVFPILTVVVTQLVGVEKAGMFSMAFVVGLLLMIVANYGIRVYQVSDVDESYSFSDYQANRIITCVIMMVVGAVYCLIRGYSEDMFIISMAVYFYKMIDGLADVYEGRLQQIGKLYLAGISQALRSVVVLIVFSIVLFITRSITVSSLFMAIASVATLVVFTLPLALFETPKSRKLDMSAVFTLLKQCFPIFISLFAYALINNMPRFVMEGVLSYDNQLYFNALYFPAQGILLTIGMLYKPQIVRMAKLWADETKRKKFDLMIVVFLAIIVVFTLFMVFIMGWIGIPIMSFLYGVDFEEFRGLCYIMLASGAVITAIDFLYQVITVLRHQKSVMKIYVITLGFSLFIPALLVNFTGLPGIVISYLIIMSILLVLLVGEYFRIRMGYAREAALQSEENTVRQRPSEARAERERLAQHRGEGRSKNDTHRRK